MVVAMIHPEGGGEGGRGRKGVVATHFPMVSKTSLQRARKVLRFASELVPRVLSTPPGMPLEDAYQEARNREQLGQSDEAKVERLRNEAPDLADLVTEERMQLNEAISALQERQRKDREIIEHGKMAADTGLTRYLADVTSIMMGAKRVPPWSA
jgi:hypothetical protein